MRLFIIFVSFKILIGCILLHQSILIVSENEVVILETFGRYSRTLEPGLYFLKPFQERARTVIWYFRDFFHHGQRVTIGLNDYRIPTTENIYNLLPLFAISIDKIQMETDLVVFYKITNPIKAVYSNEDPYRALHHIINSGIREVIASATVDELIRNSVSIETYILKKTEKCMDLLGINITNVEVLRVTEA